MNYMQKARLNVCRQTKTPLMLGRNSSDDICFSCQKRGHWARHCPQKIRAHYSPTTTTTTSTSTTMININNAAASAQQQQQQQQRRHVRFLKCACGRPCSIYADSSRRRLFYRCPSTTTTQQQQQQQLGAGSCIRCKWVDEVRGGEEEDLERISVPLPVCSCRAGPCRISTHTHGPHAGLTFFLCNIPKGQGACSFSQPLDAYLMTLDTPQPHGSSSPHPILGTCDDTRSNKDVNEERDFINGQRAIGTPSMVPPFCLGAVGGESTEQSLPRMGKDKEAINVPVCSSGAGGPCCISTNTTASNVGCETSAQGARDFYKLLDTPAVTANGCEGSFPSSPTIRDDTSLAIDVIGSPVMNTPDFPERFEPVSRQVKRSKEMLVQLEGQEEASLESLQKHTKRLRHGAMNIYVEVPLVENFQISSVFSDVQLRFTQGLWKQMSNEVSASIATLDSFSSALSRNFVRELVTSATSQNIGLHFNGWWGGRLAYPPSRCLISTTPKPFPCCTSPSFDPLIATKNVNRISLDDSEAVSATPLDRICEDAHPGSLVLWEPSRCGTSYGTDQGNVMTSAISEWFAQVAVRIQNELLALLESMSFHKHVSMLQEATDAFIALDQLKVDYEPFRLKVKEYIERARLLDEIGGTICSDGMYDMCVYKQDQEKVHFEKVSRDAAKAKADVEACSEQVRTLEEEDSRLRKMLIRVETELLCYRAEKEKHESVYLEMSKEMTESGQRLEVAMIEAAEALEARKRKEMEAHAAKAAFEKAKSLLRA